jgi:hypothetical protein
LSTGANYLPFVKPSMKRINLPCCILVLLAGSCSKHSGTPPAQNDVDIFIGGSYYIQETPGHTVAYWKNNEAPTILHTPLVMEGTGTWDLAELNGEILVTGWIQGVAHLWKNGEQIPLAGFNEESQARDIAIAGNDIYIAGTIIDRTKSAPGYWKNGDFVQLTQYLAPHLDIGYCTGIAVEGNDVHIVGRYSYYTLYWKNGKLDTLANNSTPEPKAIKVVNGNVYITGSLDGKPVYWKNGEPVVVSAQGHVADIVIENENIHLAVNEGNNVYYWKNGVSTLVGVGDASKLAVNGNDVYITGSYRSGSMATTAVYWKNGEQHRLTPDTDYRDHEMATGIAIVPRK